MSEHLLYRRAGRTWFGRAAADAAGFQAHVAAMEGAVLVRLEGELDMASAARFERALDTALEKGALTVTLDLRQLTFLDSTGIHVLVSGNRRAADQAARWLSVPRPARS